MRANRQTAIAKNSDRELVNTIMNYHGYEIFLFEISTNCFHHKNRRFEMNVLHIQKTGIAFSSVLLLMLTSASLYAQSDIILKNTFIKKCMDRATIDVHYVLDHAKAHPNPIGSGGSDGDLHTTGRSSDIQLPMVAEIINAAQHQEGVNIAHSIEGNGKAVSLSGFWRVWCEHPGRVDQVQGQTVPIPTTTNPDHIFEIHPITKLGSVDLSTSITVIPNYVAYTADKAFQKYENEECDISSTSTTTTITTKKIGYNYAKFTIELNEDDQEVVPDGRIVHANVLSSNGDEIATDIRMIFLKGSDAEQRVKTLDTGANMTLLGIPRVNLSEDMDLAKKAKKTGKPVHTKLPYEMIVVGAYP
jgi:hypothetical protein